MGREVARRTIGLRHRDLQLIGGLALHYGYVVETTTGQGKTLMSTLPSFLNAIAGYAVHIITINNYLAKRDAEYMGQIFSFLGLSVGCVPPSQEKQKAYASDVVYVTAQELAFDYLKTIFANKGDLIIFKAITLQHEKRQSGLFFAMVDEVDFVLIDNAINPCLLSRDINKSDRQKLEIAWKASKKMLTKIHLKKLISITNSNT